MVSLMVQYAGGSEIAVVPPAPACLVLGTGPDCDVVLFDPAVDAEHLLVEETPQGLRITDQGSVNGTKLNGLYVSQGLVKPGDVLTIGSVTIEVASGAGAAVPGQAPAAPPPAPVAPRPAQPAPPIAPPLAPPPAPPPSRKKAPSAPSKPRTREAPTEEVAPAPRVQVAAVRSASRARPHKVNPVVLGVGGLVVVLLGIFAVMYGNEQARLEAAAGACNRAKAHWEAERYDQARRGFSQVVSTWPDTPAALRAERSLEELEKELARERAALAGRTNLDGQWLQLSFEEFKKAYGELRSKFHGTKVFTDGVFLDQIRTRYRDEAERRFTEVRDRAATLARGERYFDAILAWHEYIYVPQNIPPDIPRATGEFKEIETIARSAYEAVKEEVERLVEKEQFEKAKDLLSGKIEAFRGTRQAFALRQKLDLVAVLEGTPEVEEATPEVVEAKIGKRQEYLRAAEDAEALVTRRRYAEAVALYRKAAKYCPHEDLKTEFLARADELTGIAGLFTTMLDQIRATPERFRGIDLGHGFKADAVGADEDSLFVDVRGATSKLAWSRMGPERVLSLLLRLKLPPVSKLHLAAFAFVTGDEDAAHAALTSAVKEDESLRTRAFGVLARARGIPVPSEGFVLHRKRWMTVKEKEDAELREAIADAAKDARSSDLRRRKEGLEKLNQFGARARSTLIEVLGYLRERTVEDLISHPLVKDPAVKTALFNELKERRKIALALIYDQVKYPYPHPDGPEYEAVQAEVDQLVANVRVIWEKPIGRLIEKNEELRELYSLAEEYSLELGRLGRKPNVSFEALIARVNAAIDMPHFTPDSTSRNNLEWSEKVLAYNKAIDIGEDEQETKCVLTLNGYRMMMGRRAVKSSAKLLECARAHSKEMKEQNYFAHDCPLPGAEHDPHRKPTQRARIAGYGGGVSENIARGSQDGAATHWQWYRSSGHHRNLLGKNHTEVGIGRVEEFWTQNFGSVSKSVEVPRAPRPGGG